MLHQQRYPRCRSLGPSPFDQSDEHIRIEICIADHD
jgi:hypothetical protein